jgi:hypothetical protein
VLSVGADLSLSGLTITGGVADNINYSYTAGGGLCCDSGADIIADDITLTGNAAFIGGGLFVEGCDMALSDATVTDNSAAYGGGINWSLGDLSITDSLIDSNSASTSGGGIYTGRYGDKTIDLIDTIISNNTATYGGGLFVADSAEITCTGSKGADAGFFSNSSGGAIRIYANFSGSLTADVCDFGESGTADDNTGSDIELSGGTSDTYGDDESFSCDRSSCE